jgi:hypothetical protein
VLDAATGEFLYARDPGAQNIFTFDPVTGEKTLLPPVLPEGVRVSGTYQTMIGVPFETLWQLCVSEGKIVATLEKLKSGLLSLGVAKSYLLRTVAGAVDMLELSGDKILLDVDLLLRNRGIPLRTNLTAIRCDYGSLTVESDEAR